MIFTSNNYILLDSLSSYLYCSETHVDIPQDIRRLFGIKWRHIQEMMDTRKFHIFGEIVNIYSQGLHNSVYYCLNVTKVKWSHNRWTFFLTDASNLHYFPFWNKQHVCCFIICHCKETNVKSQTSRRMKTPKIRNIV